MKILLFLMMVSCNFFLGGSFKVNSLSRSICRLHPKIASRLVSSRAFSSSSVQNADWATPRIIFVLGGPGSGKGTQCEMISSRYGVRHISAGHLLREEQKSNSKNGQLIESILKAGKIVPAQITMDLLQQAIMKTVSGGVAEVNVASSNSSTPMWLGNLFLIDGFPRNIENLQVWECSVLGQQSRVEGVLFLDCPQDELERRLTARGVSSGRSDDNLETIRSRFTTFERETQPIVDIFERRGKVLRINGLGQPHEVFLSVQRKIEPIINELP